MENTVQQVWVEEPKKKAILTMGLPGAGKSHILSTLNLSGFVIIDPDEIKQEKEDYDPKQPEIYHEWSKAQAKARTVAAMEAGKNLVVDGTGTNIEKMLKQIRDLQAVGYVVELLYVRVTLETAIRRNAARKRVVATKVIHEKYETITYAFESLSQFADIANVQDND